MSLYDTLGVAADATADAIKRTYRKKVMGLHPDRNGGDADTFLAVQRAYDILGNPERRKRYDETGETRDTDSMEDAVRQDCIGMFMACIDHHADSLELIDPIELCLVEVDKIKEAIAERILIQRKATTLRHRALQKLQARSGDRLLINAILGDIEARKRTIADNQEKLKRGDRMKEIFKQFNWS